MATSPALEKILTAKRADPYSDDKTIEQLRANHKAGGTAIPLPDGTTFEAVDAVSYTHLTLPTICSV